MAMGRGGGDQSIFFRVVVPEKLPMSRDGLTLRHLLVSLGELGGFKVEHIELGKKGRTDKGEKVGVDLINTLYTSMKSSNNQTVGKNKNQGT